MNLTRYHQSGFVLESAGKRIAVDIAMLTPLEEVHTIGRVDAALVSHAHQDHFSEAHLAALTEDVYSVQEAISQIKDPLLMGHAHKVGDSFLIPHTPFVVTLFPSDHGPHVSKPVENSALHISDGLHAVYFLGDMYNPAAPISEPYDALIIPVGNGNYTFGPQEAAAYVRELDWTGLTIPVHYNPQQGTEHTPDEFALLANEAIVHKLEIGESLDIA